MIDHIVLQINSSTKSSSQAFVSGAIEPYDSINTTWDKCLWWWHLLSWIGEQLSLFAFNFPLGCLKVS